MGNHTNQFWKCFVMSPPKIVINTAQVLYLIVRRHREDSHHRVFLANSTVSPLMGFCWRLRRRKGPPAFFLDNGEDEMP